MSASIDEERMRKDLAQLRALMALRMECELAYSDAQMRREVARRAYVELVARPGGLDPEEHRRTRRLVAQAQVALDTASRALLETKREIDLARLQYDVDHRSSG